MSTNQFDGEWVFPGEPGIGSYGYRISGTIGICTKANSKMYQVGDVMLNIERTADNIFFGKQIFTDGAWHDISGKLEGDTLAMIGEGFHWRMVRVKN